MTTGPRSPRARFTEKENHTGISCPGNKVPENAEKELVHQKKTHGTGFNDDNFKHPQSSTNEGKNYDLGWRDRKHCESEAKVHTESDSQFSDQ